MRWSNMQGGWALVREGELAATVRFEVGGLMSCRSAEALDAEMQALYAEGRKVDWMYEPTFRPRWYPGFPERLMFATLTCAPWSWVLVAPCEQAPLGFVNVQTGPDAPGGLVTATIRRDADERDDAAAIGRRSDRAMPSLQPSPAASSGRRRPQARSTASSA